LRLPDYGLDAQRRHLSEADMNFKTALCIAALFGSAGAIAQTNSTGSGTSGSAGGQGIQPGKTAEAMQMVDPPNAGSSAQGSLMQKREQGMSKQGQSEKDKTGQIKQ
jgi:hypothetical protein